MVAMQCAGAEASFRDGRFSAKLQSQSVQTTRTVGGNRPPEEQGI